MKLEDFYDFIVGIHDAEVEIPNRIKFKNRASNPTTNNRQYVIDQCKNIIARFDQEPFEPIDDQWVLDNFAFHRQNNEVIVCDVMQINFRETRPPVYYIRSLNHNWPQLPDTLCPVYRYQFINLAEKLGIPKR